jgi:hypothetical protein
MTMKKLGAPVRAAVLAAAAGAGAAIPLRAVGGGYWHAPGPPPTGGGYWHAGPAPSGGSIFDFEDFADQWDVPEWNFNLWRLFERRRKEPFDHYAHNPDDLRLRPICPPHCEPWAGYYEPGWRQLPCNPGDPQSALPVLMHEPGGAGLVPPPAPSATRPPSPLLRGNEPGSPSDAPRSNAPPSDEPPAAPPSDEYDPPSQTGNGPSFLTPVNSVSPTSSNWKPAPASSGWTPASGSKWTPASPLP